MEGRLDDLLSAECTRLSRGNLKVRLSQYYRQYAGAYRDHRRVVLINAFSKGDVRLGRACNWRKEAIQIADGGQWYFHAAYDVESHRFGWFHFNGPLRGTSPPANRWDEILREQTSSKSGQRD
jgi:hypothetical protein